MAHLRCMIYCLTITTGQAAKQLKPARMLFALYGDTQQFSYQFRRKSGSIQVWYITIAALINLLYLFTRKYTSIYQAMVGL